MIRIILADGLGSRSDRVCARAQGGAMREGRWLRSYGAILVGICPFPLSLVPFTSLSLSL